MQMTPPRHRNEFVEIGGVLGKCTCQNQWLEPELDFVIARECFFNNKKRPRMQGTEGFQNAGTSLFFLRRLHEFVQNLAK